MTEPHNRPVREASAHRETAETQIAVRLVVDGEGRFSGSVGIPFFEHMLNLLARHAMMDIEINGKGDTDVDAHHTVEDVGIVMGRALKTALETRHGIERYGEAYVPMEETLARCVIDICNRPFLKFDAQIPKTKIGDFDAELAEDFMRAFAFNACLTMHITVIYGGNMHHVVEAVFKSVGRALAKASSRNPRIIGAHSTKGSLE
ncbi:MAG: imidazoleglycerol-phosphate dehydratase HisB [Candidatus Sumerlaeota bacterium]|nr:imidazoleglycerol-phosphate dehydratase HisB [Candidatus Sumerlaeota bacterium]